MRQADPDDRRRQIVSLLAKGQTIINDNIEEGARIAAKFRDTLGEDDYEQLLDLLERLIQAKCFLWLDRRG